MIFPDLKLRHKRWPVDSSIGDLTRFAYLGGACIHVKNESTKLNDLLNQEPSPERLPLLETIKEELISYLETGKSLQTVTNMLAALKRFFVFVDERNLECNLPALKSNYLEYAEHLFLASQKTKPDIKPKTAYQYAFNLSQLFSSMLDLENPSAILFQTRLKHPGNNKKSKGKAAEKQNLEDTFIFGSFLVDLCNGLTKEFILGQIPLRLSIRPGLTQNNEIIFWAGVQEHTLANYEKPISEINPYQRQALKKALRSRAPVDELSSSDRGRWSIANIRVLAELMVFIAQTGMDFSTACNIRRERFKYKPVGKNYQVREYKNRRGGEVFFEIFKSYKAQFERHIAFINQVYPDSEWLFPVWKVDGSIGQVVRMDSLARFIQKHNAPWISPQLLKNTRVNYLLRRSADVDITAEMDQHTKAVLKQQYEMPSQQRSMTEITRFWNKHDPIKKGSLKASVVSGQCDGIPEAIEGKPTSVVEPNCINPSGCLWCKRARDIDSNDYVWALFSFRYLKSIEASLVISSDKVPADLAVLRLSEKIDWYRQSNANRSNWVKEAEQKIDEGYYHPAWSNLIEFLE